MKLLKRWEQISIQNSISIFKSNKLNRLIYHQTLPRFPSDLSSIYGFMTQEREFQKSKKIFLITSVFLKKENGAKIEIKDKVVVISGPSKFTGAEVMAIDLRASVSLVLAGLIADNRQL